MRITCKAFYFSGNIFRKKYFNIFFKNVFFIEVCFEGIFEKDFSENKQNNIVFICLLCSLLHCVANILCLCSRYSLQQIYRMLMQQIYIIQIRYSLLLKIHIQVIKNVQIFLYCLLYLCNCLDMHRVQQIHGRCSKYCVLEIQCVADTVCSR